MAKIAAELARAVAERARNGAPGGPRARPLAQGRGWDVSDVLCTSGPHDRPFEEIHDRVSVTLVLAGSFEYRTTSGRALLPPGSVLLGSPGRCYECGHEHAAGDRCLSFHYSPEYFEQLTAGSGATAQFAVSRLPPMRELSPLFARGCMALAAAPDTATADGPEWAGAFWEGLGVQLAVRATEVAHGLAGRTGEVSASAAARVTRVVRLIERHADSGVTLDDLAREERLSPYHFLRVFQQLTGVTPHQYILRIRLRKAALALATESSKILDIALDAGFGDVSNFNRVFRAEFGLSPREYRKEANRGFRRIQTD